MFNSTRHHHLCESCRQSFHVDDLRLRPYDCAEDPDVTIIALCPGCNELYDFIGTKQS